MFLKSHTKSDIHIFAYYARALSFLLLFLSLSYSIVADFMVIILLSKMYISLVILCQSCLEVCRKSFTPCIFFFFYLVFDGYFTGVCTRYVRKIVLFFKRGFNIFRLVLTFSSMDTALLTLVTILDLVKLPHSLLFFLIQT